MKQKLLNPKDYSPCCEYCIYGRQTADGESILCIKKGVMLPQSSCRKYEYDPLKRKPKIHAVIDTDFDSEDFKL